tara:strand:- start:911 stop:2428 length:1518 start_codon:yes stop_codon:yes gene_type:complete
MAIPSLAMRPSAEAANRLYSVLPNNGDGDFQFNRDSSATLINSKGLIQTVGYFGSELVTNGDFANDSDWNKTQATISNGVANISSDGSYAAIDQSNVSVIGKTYLYSIDVKSITGTMQFRLGSGTDVDITTTGVKTGYIVATSTTLEIKRKAGAGAINVTIDNVSVQEVTGDRPRFNYEITNGLVGGCPSLLLEPASTNSFPNSEDYTVFSPASNGTGTNPVITSNYSVSPDGTQNADRIQFNRGSGTSSNDTSYVTKSLSLGTIDATLSIYLKTNDGTTKDVTLRLGTGLFDYDVIVTSDWQRFTLSGNTSVDRVQILLYGHKNSQNADLSCFGTQVETLSYATSYIPTNGAIQTRAAETCFGAGTASTFSDSEGVLYAELKALSADGTNRYISLNDGTTSNRVNLFYDTNNVLRGFITGISSMPTSATITDNNKVAIKYKSGDIALWLNGVEVATKTDAISLSGLSSLSFDQTGGLNWYGNVKDIRVYNEALTDLQLQNLTTL